MGRIGLKAIIWFEVATTVALIIGSSRSTSSSRAPACRWPAATRATSRNWPPPSRAPGTSSCTSSDVGLRRDGQGRHPADRRLCDVLRIALAAVGSHGKPVYDFMESTAQVMFKFTGYVMKFAPLGVFAAIAYTVGSKGLGIPGHAGQAGAGDVRVAGAVRAAGDRRRGVGHPRAVPDVREGGPRTVPHRVHDGEQRGGTPQGPRGHGALRRPKTIVSSCCRRATASNLDGTTLYLSLASVFVAQLAGVELSIGTQVVMMLTLMLTSKGVAGVRARAGRADGDADELRPAARGRGDPAGHRPDHGHGPHGVNVMGNCIATAVVARWEGVFDDEKMRAFANGAQGGANGAEDEMPGDAVTPPQARRKSACRLWPAGTACCSG